MEDKADETGASGTTREFSLVGVGCVVVGLGALCFAAFLFWEIIQFPYSLDGPMKYVALHPSGNEAVFVKWGFQNSRISLFVRPKGESELIWVGTLDSEASLRFGKAYWSADGSVIAGRSFVKEFSKDLTSREELMIDAYDFSKRQPIVGPEDLAVESCWARDARSELIESLLRERGGKVECLEDKGGGEFSKEFVKVSYFEWVKLRNLEAVPWEKEQ